jgi:hypothetical protein
MTGPDWAFLALAAAMLALYVVTGIELDRRTAQRDRLARRLAHVTRQRDLTEAERADLDDAERAELQARLDAKVLPFGPVQTGVVKRIPGQRKGGGA